MSGAARAILVVFCLVWVGLLAAIPWLFPGSGFTLTNPVVLGIVGFLLLIVVACCPGPCQSIAGRLIGALIFAACVGYVWEEIGKPLPTLATYRRSDTNLVNALFAFVTFGLPAAAVAVTGALPGGADPLENGDGGERLATTGFEESFEHVPGWSREAIRYILTYTADLMTPAEILAYRSVLAEQKVQQTQNPVMRLMLRNRWVSTDREAAKLLKDGPAAFIAAVCTRITALPEAQDRFNRCPRCGALARTPRAKQCPSCFHSWHAAPKTENQK